MNIKMKIKTEKNEDPYKYKYENIKNIGMNDAANISIILKM